MKSCCAQKRTAKNKKNSSKWWISLSVSNFIILGAILPLLETSPKVWVSMIIHVWFEGIVTEWDHQYFSFWVDERRPWEKTHYFFLISSSERYTKCLDAQFFAKYFIFKARQDQVHSYLQIYNVRPIFTNDLENKIEIFSGTN